MPGNDKENESGALGIVGVCVFINVVAIVSAVIAYVMSISAYKRYNTPKQHLLNLLNDKENLIDKSNVQEAVVAVAKFQPRESEDKPYDQAKIDAFLISITDQELVANAQAQGKLETVSGARDEGKLPIFKENRATLKSRPSNLHVSKLEDLYGNPLFLAASPLKTQFVDHWELIWQEKIGVIMWIGRLTQGRMDAYVELHEGKEMTHGPFLIKTKKAFDRLLKFAIYDLEVHYQGAKRELFLIHAYEWLQDSATWALRRDVEVMVQLKDTHIKQIVGNLPGVLLQCKLGTAGSAVALSVYLGFQTWLRETKVNLVGILKHVRRNRWKAFEETGDPSHAFHVQVKVVYTIMYGLTKFIESKKLAVYDEVLKEVLCASRSMALPV